MQPSARCFIGLKWRALVFFRQQTAKQPNAVELKSKEAAQG